MLPSFADKYIFLHSMILCYVLVNVFKKLANVEPKSTVSAYSDSFKLNTYLINVAMCYCMYYPVRDSLRFIFLLL